MNTQLSLSAQLEPAAIVSLNHGKPVTTSLKVAEAFGKRHDNVLRKLESLECSAEFHHLNFEEMIHEVDIGKGAKRETKVWSMTKDGFMFLVMGFTGTKASAIKEAYINAFNWMAAQIQHATSHANQDATAILHYADMLREREQSQWRTEDYLERRLFQLMTDMEQLRQEIRDYHSSRRSSRDIINHMQLHGKLMS